MKYIEKGNTPQIFSDAARRADGDYDKMHSSDKELLFGKLLQEQGYICAYCNKRISNANGHIEHWFPRNPKDPGLSDKAMMCSCDYHNLLAVCNGNAGKSFRLQTCDKSKGNTVIGISPLDEDAMATILYSADGRIYSIDEAYDSDIQDILHLNADSFMVDNRKGVYSGIIRWMENNKPSRQEVEKKLQQFLSKDAEGKYKEYCSVAIYFLKRKLDKWN